MVNWREIKTLDPISDRAILATFSNEVIIRNHLLRYGHITPNEAKDQYGMSRLAAVICNLRHKSEPRMVIDTDKESGINRLGKKTTWAKYVFKGFEGDI